MVNIPLCIMDVEMYAQQDKRETELLGSASGRVKTEEPRRQDLDCGDTMNGEKTQCISSASRKAWPETRDAKVEPSNQRGTRGKHKEPSK